MTIDIKADAYCRKMLQGIYESFTTEDKPMSANFRFTQLGKFAGLNTKLLRDRKRLKRRIDKLIKNGYLKKSKEGYKFLKRYFNELVRNYHKLELDTYTSDQIDFFPTITFGENISIYGINLDEVIDEEYLASKDKEKIKKCHQKVIDRLQQIKGEFLWLMYQLLLIKMYELQMVSIMANRIKPISWEDFKSDLKGWDYLWLLDLYGADKKKYHKGLYKLIDRVNEKFKNHLPERVTVVSTIGLRAYEQSYDILNKLKDALLKPEMSIKLAEQLDINFHYVMEGHRCLNPEYVRRKRDEYLRKKEQRKE